MYIRFVLFFLIALFIGFAGSYVFINYTKQKVETPAPSAFSPDNPPRNSLKGQITTLSGDTFLESRVASEPAKLTKTQEILQGENLVTKTNGKINVAFADAETMTILPDSEIDVIQTLPANIVITQPQGNVQYTKSGNIPFSINAQSLLVNHNQGTLTVSVDKKNQTTTVVVQNGTAQVAYADTDQNSHVIILSHGQTFVYDATEQTGEIASQ